MRKKSYRRLKVRRVEVGVETSLETSMVGRPQPVTSTEPVSNHLWNHGSANPGDDLTHQLLEGTVAQVALSAPVGLGRGGAAAHHVGSPLVPLSIITLIVSGSDGHAVIPTR